MHWVIAAKLFAGVLLAILGCIILRRKSYTPPWFQQATGDPYRITLRRSTRPDRPRRLKLRGRRFEPPGNIVLQLMENMEYSGTVVLGKQKFQVIFDTGSSNLWVVGGDSNGSTSHGGYSSIQSATYARDGRLFHCHYRSGDAWGTFANDLLELRGVSANVTFGVVNDMSFRMPSESFDGIFGLGWASNSVESILTPVEALHQLEEIQEPVFAFYFAEPDLDVGEFTVGGVDATKHVGEMTWISVLPQSAAKQWAILISGVSFGQRSLGDREQFAIIDSGMSHIGIPFDLFDGVMVDFKRQWKNAIMQQFVNDVTMLDSLPNLTLRLGDTQFILTGSDYLFFDETRVAHPMLAKLPQAPPWQTFWSLGDVFFRKHYVAFDYREGGRIGIAQARRFQSS